MTMKVTAEPAIVTAPATRLNSMGGLNTDVVSKYGTSHTLINEKRPFNTREGSR